MSHLKIRVNIGSFNVELEGSSEVVISQFDELKKNGLGEIVDQLAPRMQANIQNVESPTDGSASSQESPLLLGTEQLDGQDVSLQNIVYRQLPKSETEWILIYGYFLDREGKNSFGRADLIQKYDESKRKSEVRMKNLSASIKGAITSKWLSALNDKAFIVTDKGKSYAIEILTRQEGTTRVPKKRQKKEASSHSPEVHNEPSTSSPR